MMGKGEATVGDPLGPGRLPPDHPPTVPPHLGLRNPGRQDSTSSPHSVIRAGSGQGADGGGERKGKMGRWAEPTQMVQGP